MPDEEPQIVEQPAPVALTGLEKKQIELKTQRDARIKVANELQSRRDELKKNIGQKFTDGEKIAEVTAFEQNDVADGEKDLFLVNFGNECIHKYINCSEFLTNFKLKGAE